MSTLPSLQIYPADGWDWREKLSSDLDRYDSRMALAASMGDPQTRRILESAALILLRLGRQVALHIPYRHDADLLDVCIGEITKRFLGAESDSGRQVAFAAWMILIDARGVALP